MIIYNYDQFDSRLLQLNPNVHECSWDFYSRQFVTAFSCLLNLARERHSQPNSKHRAFLFLLRHSLELLLKLELSHKGVNIPLSHNLIELARLLEEDVPTFEGRFNILECDTQGDCFRYLTDNNGQLYFTTRRVESFDCCQNFISFCNTHKPIGLAALKPLNDNKLQRGQLTFYYSECHTLGHISTHYDEAIYDLISQIQSNVVSANDVYLPLLCMIRHTIEIKLKFSLLNMGEKIEDKRVLTSCHSLHKLWNVFINRVGNAINNINDDDAFKADSLKRWNDASQFKDLIQNIDANSFILRFPFDQGGNQSNFRPNKNILQQVWSLYLTTDAFLCFAVGVLFEEGYLEIGDDVMRELME